MAGNNKATVPPPGLNSQQTHGDVESSSRKSQLTALQGATSAFNNNAKPSPPAVPPPSGGARSSSRPETPNNVGNAHVSPETSPDRHIGSVRDTIRKFTDNNGSTPDTLRVPGSNGVNRNNRPESPQWIAAQLAAGRSANKSPSPSRPEPIERGNGSGDFKHRVYNTHPRLYERDSSPNLQDEKQSKLPPAPRGSSCVERKGSIEDGGLYPNNRALDMSRQITSRPRPSEEPTKLSPRKPLTPSKPATLSRGDPSKAPQNRLESLPARNEEQILSERPTRSQILTPSPRRQANQPPTSDCKPPLPSRTNTSRSNTALSSSDTSSRKPIDTIVSDNRLAVSRSASRASIVTESTLSRVRSQNHSNTSLKPQNTGMSDDSFAIAASSIASSRAPSPSRNQPPPPPPRRSARSRSLLHPHGSRDDKSRTPSPSKGLRGTMRTHSKSDDEEDNHKKQSRRRIIKTHPHKHSEGTRKRWKDKVTETERKRYEGVWAANRGLWISPSGSAERLSANGSDRVLNLVVRELWSRSRLPSNILEQVWDLVDRQADGTLTREEFVVGMWLIDQRLKGRKLPVKVSESIWESVRQFSGATAPSLI